MFSPDGTKIAFPRYQRGTSIFDLMMVDLATGELRVATVLYYKGFDWSPDSTRLVIALK
jgi:Tol biopolymer transport system component